MAKSSKRIRITGPVEKLANEDLVDVVRGNGRKNRKQDAYNILEQRVRGKITFIIRQFFIPGFSSDDVLQEALYALRFKAIPDYDRTKGRTEDPYPFDKFALLCIRRHLSTILKSSFQNKKKALNTSLSLDQDRGSSSDDNLFLVDILPQTTGTVADEIGDKEYYKSLFSKLFQDLSPLERRVFRLYASRYSYEEISKLINRHYRKTKQRKKTNVKSIDNALSRIKQKARDVYKRHGED